MKNKLKILLIMASIITLSGNCDSIIGEDDELSIKRRDYTGNELRIDGYYYRIGYKKEINSVIFFYKNGIILDIGGVENSHEEMKQHITKNYLKDDFVKRNKTSWGVFKIENNDINYEQWYAGDRPHKAYIMFGVILNDTTFHIKESWRSGKKEDEIYKEDRIYHFKQFSPKPDSTNSFIE